jgi:hypothetical protein
MKSKLFVSFLLLGGLIAVCGPVFAHHGSTVYETKVSELKGASITKFLWANPHCIVQFDAKDEKGTVLHWAVETGSASSVTGIGWNRNSLRPGDVVTVSLWRAKSGNPVGRLNKIVLADGTTLRDTVLGGDKGDRPEDRQ